MAQVLFNDSIQSLVIASSSTITQAPSIITLGGQQYRSTSALTLNTAVSGAGGIDTGAVAASTTYYMYGVLSGSALALVASLSSSAPTGFTQYSKIGAFSTGSSSAIEDAYLNSEIEDITLITERAIGSVGAAPQLATYGSLGTADFPTPANAHVYGLNSDSNDANTGTPKNLTQVGSPIFNSVGLFGKENLLSFDGVNDVLTSTDAFFNITTGSFTMGGWFKRGSTLDQYLMGRWNDTANRQYLMYFGADGLVNFLLSSNGSAVATTVAPVANIPAEQWAHVVAVFDNPNNLAKVYVNGQLAGSAAAAFDLFSGNGTFAINGYQNAGAFSLHRSLVAQDLFFTTDVLTDTQINNIYSKSFKGGQAQIAGGHTLTANSFPVTSLSNKVNLYNLDTANDSSVNAKHLTGDAAPANHSGLGLTGTGNAATFLGAQSLKSTDAYFNFGGKAIGYGGWFAANDYTPTSRIVLMSFSDGASDRSIIAIESTPAGQVTFECTDSGGAKAATVSSPGFVDGSWHHFVLVQDGVNIYGFIDGVQVCQTSAVGYMVSLASPVFRISGRNASLSNPFPGRVSSAYAYKDLVLSGTDIQKLASSRVEIGQTMNPARQQWEADFENESEKIKNDFGQSWLVDKRSDHIYVDFGGASASRVKLKLRKK